MIKDVLLIHHAPHSQNLDVSVYVLSINAKKAREIWKSRCNASKFSRFRRRWCDVINLILGLEI